MKGLFGREMISVANLRKILQMALICTKKSCVCEFDFV